MIVLDTDFFSSFFKIGILKLILDASGEEKFPWKRLKELSRIYARKIFMRLAKKWRGNYYVRPED